MAQQEHQNGAAEKIAAAAAVSFTAVKPQLLVEAPKANDAIQFYKTAFGAEELSRTLHPKRKAEQELPLILSAELQLGASTILVSDFADDSAATVKTGGNGVVFSLETEDVDAAIFNAVNAGAVAEGEVVEGEGACCGGRVGKLKDPYGFAWVICAPKKNCADAEA